MLEFMNNCDTAVVVLHEIYGINRHILDVCGKLSGLGLDVFAPDLLAGHAPFAYEQKDIAYRNFIENVGFFPAAEQAKNLLQVWRGQYGKLFVVGYSVGATTAWLCSRHDKLCDGVIGFYGSRIRDHLEIIPQCPVLLFFPEQERTFDVNFLTESLNRKEKVTARKLDGEHGFADPFSNNYREDSCLRAYSEMINFIRK